VPGTTWRTWSERRSSFLFAALAELRFSWRPLSAALLAVMPIVMLEN